MIVKSLKTADGGELQLEIPTFLEVLEEATSSVAREDLKLVLEHLLRRGLEIRELPPGWDSYGAAPPRADVLDFALLFAARACIFLARQGWPMIEPFLVPTAAGSIQLEWKHSSRELEVEISEPGDFSLLVVDEHGREHEESCSEEKVFQYLRWLATGELK